MIVGFSWSMKVINLARLFPGGVASITLLEFEMKLLTAVLFACSLSASFAVHAESLAPVHADAQQMAQANTSQPGTYQAPRRPATTPARDANTCVGPASFCNLFFGS
ncbi:hypothetical protein ACLKMY_36145 [Paraburkholderia mimosarum]|uniref:hypothetical protein n=1 Tax=Paraburkholderia mimosarum TaxID=312026 RepID=UPI0039C01887